MDGDDNQQRRKRPDADTPNPLRAGQSFQTCLRYLPPGGITKVAYTGTNAYETSPVTWTMRSARG
jgi:hypothetical protein